MKRIIALVMALVMMMAVTVPAFAAVKNENDDPINTVEVTVDADSASEKWTVTIPAAINLTWGDTATPKAYTMDCQLKENRALVVSANVAQILTSDAGTIEFTLSGDISNIKSPTPVYKGTHNFSIDVTEDAWNAATIADYTGTISFSAEVIDNV